MTTNSIYLGLKIKNYFTNGPFLADNIQYIANTYSKGEIANKHAQKYIQNLSKRKQSNDISINQQPKKRQKIETLPKDSDTKIFCYAVKENKVIKKTFYFPKDKNNCYEGYNEFVIFDNEDKYIYDVFNNFVETQHEFIKRNCYDTAKHKLVRLLISQIDIDEDEIAVPRVISLNLNIFNKSLNDRKKIKCHISSYYNQYQSLINDQVMDDYQVKTITINSDGKILVDDKEYKINQMIIYAELK